jgi:hypothetical protein
MKSSFKKTALASVVAGALTAGAAIPQAEADVLYVSWQGAFTMLTPTGTVLRNNPSDYVYGEYANGDGNVYGSGGAPTTHGWIGYRTPITGTMAFDVTTGAGVATVTPFQFFGDNPGSGAGTTTASALGVTFQVTDFTAGTMVGSMLFNWNGGNHSISIVLDASGMFSQLGTANNPGPAMIDFMTNGPTTTISGVGALPATNGVKSGTIPLGPSPVATTTMNALGCEAKTLATQVNAYTIVTNFANLGTCSYVNDTIGGSPMASSAFGNHNGNFDVLSVHLDNFVQTPQPPQVPVPAAVWLFGSGLLGLVGIARRKKKA